MHRFKRLPRLMQPLNCDRTSLSRSLSRSSARQCIETGEDSGGYSIGECATKGQGKAAPGVETRWVTTHNQKCVFRALTEASISFDYQVFLPFRTCGLESETRHAFADFVIARPCGSIVLEVDEEQHSAYDTSCDPRRDFDIFASVAMGSAEKVTVLRYNPNPYKVGGVTRPTPQNEKLQKLLSVIEGPEPSEKRLFLYYDRPSVDATLPCVAGYWDIVARIISRCVD